MQKVVQGDPHVPFILCPPLATPYIAIVQTKNLTLYNPQNLLRFLLELLFKSTVLLVLEIMALDSLPFYDEKTESGRGLKTKQSSAKK